MAKRLTMVVLFVGAIGLASLITPSTAEARGCYRSYGGHYHRGPVYSRSYYGGGYYAPYRTHPRSYYHHHHHDYWGGSGLYYGGHRGGLYIRF